MGPMPNSAIDTPDAVSIDVGPDMTELPTLTDTHDTVMADSPTLMETHDTIMADSEV